MKRVPDKIEHDEGHANCCGGHTVNSDPQVLQMLRKRLQDVKEQRSSDRHSREAGIQIPRRDWTEKLRSEARFRLDSRLRGNDGFRRANL